jgi:hypothetical protein
MVGSSNTRVDSHEAGSAENETMAGVYVLGKGYTSLNLTPVAPMRVRCVGGVVGGSLPGGE